MLPSLCVTHTHIHNDYPTLFIIFLFNMCCFMNDDLLAFGFDLHLHAVPLYIVALAVCDVDVQFIKFTVRFIDMHIVRCVSPSPSLSVGLLRKPLWLRRPLSARCSKPDSPDSPESLVSAGVKRELVFDLLRVVTVSALLLV